MRVLVTGASGLLGGAVARAVAAAGHEVTTFQRRPSGVARVRDVADERRVHITLTPAGRKLKTRAVDVPACLLAASQCSLDELAGLTQQIQTLRDRIKAA